MTLLKILWITVGLAFSTFGYFIYFKKTYHLINGFKRIIKRVGKQNQLLKKLASSN